MLDAPWLFLPAGHFASLFFEPWTAGHFFQVAVPRVPMV